MADTVLVSGLEKLQIEGSEGIQRVQAREPKAAASEKLQCDISESGDGSGSEKEKDASVLKSAGQVQENKNKKKKVPRKKKAAKKNLGESILDDNLQCDDSSDSKSGSGDDSGDSKSGSGDDSGDSKSGSNSGESANESSELKVKQEKGKGLIEKIKEKFSRKSKEEISNLAKEDITETKETDKQNVGNLECHGSGSKSTLDGDMGSGSCPENNQETSTVKASSEGGKKKVLRKPTMKKSIKKNKEVVNTTERLQCDDSSESKSGSGDDSSGSKSGSGDDNADSKSGSGDDSSGSKSGSGDDSACETGPSNKMDEAKVESANIEKNEPLKVEEENQVTETTQDAPVEKTITIAKPEVGHEMEEGQNARNKINKHEVEEQGTSQKKGILGKIMEKLPGYYKNSGE